ncbi:MAG: hypothetical protein SFZ03_01435 [Candidatus Melainabacteria bacterium]|nr:hypothetical protein [Candidatus Melainabacteria bacterium]
MNATLLTHTVRFNAYQRPEDPANPTGVPYAEAKTRLAQALSDPDQFQADPAAYVGRLSYYMQFANSMNRTPWYKNTEHVARDFADKDTQRLQTVEQDLRKKIAIETFAADFLRAMQETTPFANAFATLPQAHSEAVSGVFQKLLGKRFFPKVAEQLGDTGRKQLETIVTTCAIQGRLTADQRRQYLRVINPQMDVVG